jgi:hypothetical protein
MYRKPADRLFEAQQGLPQPNLGSDSLEFSALTTFNREAVLSKFLPSFDGFGRKTASKATAESQAAAAAAAATAAAAAAANKPGKLSSAALASANERRVQQATQQQSSADRLEEYRRLAREEQRLSRAARQEQSKLNGLWDAASRVVRHRRQRFAPHLAGSARQRNAAWRNASNSAARTEGKRRATSALIADPPLSLIREGLAEGYTDELQGILQSVPEPFMQLLRGVFAAQDDDADGLLTIEQLRRAVLGLGLADTPDTLERFVKLSKHKPLVDAVSFVYVIAMLTNHDGGSGAGGAAAGAGGGAGSPRGAAAAGAVVPSTAGSSSSSSSSWLPVATAPPALPQDCAAEVLEVLETVREWVTTAELNSHPLNSSQQHLRRQQQQQPPRAGAAWDRRESSNSDGGGGGGGDAGAPGVIETDMLRHVLRVHTGTQLSANEIEDFMNYAQGVMRAQDAQRQEVGARRRAAGAATATTKTTMASTASTAQRGGGYGSTGAGASRRFGGGGGGGGGGGRRENDGGNEAGEAAAEEGAAAATMNLDRLIHHLVDYSGSASPYLL